LVLGNGWFWATGGSIAGWFPATVGFGHGRFGFGQLAGRAPVGFGNGRFRQRLVSGNYRLEQRLLLSNGSFRAKVGFGQRLVLGDGWFPATVGFGQLAVRAPVGFGQRSFSKKRGFRFHFSPKGATEPPLSAKLKLRRKRAEEGPRGRRSEQLGNQAKRPKQAFRISVRNKPPQQQSFGI